MAQMCHRRALVLEIRLYATIRSVSPVIKRFDAMSFFPLSLAKIKIGQLFCVIACFAAVTGLEAQTLKMRFEFENAVGNKTTDPVSGRSLTFTNNAGLPADLRGALGSGVMGAGQSLDFRSGTFSSGCSATTTGNQNINFGTVSNFTVSFWVKPLDSLYSTNRCLFLALGFFNSLSSMTTNYGQEGSISVGCGGDRIDGQTSLQVAINATDNAWTFDLPTNKWTFVAVTYDGTHCQLYRGTEQASVELVVLEELNDLEVNVGAKFNLLVGNSFARDASFIGEMDDVRIYLGAANQNALEAIRREAAPPPLVISAAPDGNTMGLMVNTQAGSKYVLQSTSNFPPEWNSISTNVAASTSLTVKVPMSKTSDQFFRYVELAPGSSRSDLVIGEYKPDALTTGVLPGTVLTDYNASSVDSFTISQAGTIIQNKRIYGDIHINAANVVIRNCELVGGNHTPSGASGVVDCNGSGVYNALIEDCDIVPRKISRNRDGIVGHEYTARRNHVRNTIDGFGVFNKAGVSVSANVSLEGNYVHDLAYFYPDWRNGVSGSTWHSDGSHNDCVQIQGGANIHVIGNNLTATSIAGPGTGANPDKPWLIGTGNANGAAIIIQKNVGELVDVVVEKNWLSHGLAEANFKPGTYTFQNNICGRAVASNPPSWSGYWLRVDSRAGTTINGLLDPGNRWEDTGELLTEPRAKGIHYNQ